MSQEKMLRQRERRNIAKIDKAILADVVQTAAMLKDLAKKQGASLAVQKLAANVVSLSEEGDIHTAIIFLTEKQQNENSKKVLKWIGIDQELKDEKVFNASTNGTLVLDRETKLKIHLFHFDRYPFQKLSEEKYALKIIIYDASYKNDYQNWELAFDILSSDVSAQLLINIGEENGESIDKIALFKGVTRQMHVNSLEPSLREILLEEHFKAKIHSIRVYNYLQFLYQVYGLIANDLKQKEDQFRGKSILFSMKTTETKRRDTTLSSKEVSFLKTIIDTELKQLVRSIEDKIENFDKEEPQYKDLEEEISSFLGFVENKSGKYVTLSISEGAIQDKINKSNGLLMGFFKKIIEISDQKIKHIETIIKDQFADWKLDPPQMKRPPITNDFSKEILAANNTLPDKPYEKQISFKGIGGLIMELRTPLFMLMPFMMIFALFGALVGGGDKGHVDESILFYNNRPAVAIDQLPESRGNQYRMFINDVEELRGPKKGVFDKEISSELITEPQLAVKLVEVSQSFRNATKMEETLDYHFDNKNQMIYLYLKENADRNYVIDKLYDPSLGLLTIPSNTRRSMGIGGLIRGLSGLSEYRYLILVGLVLLIVWFVFTRKSSMDSELKMSKNREKQRLNSDLKQFIDKNVKQSIHKWRGKLIDELNNCQNILLKTAEKNLIKNIEIKKQQKLQEDKVIQKRMTTIRNEKSQLSALQSEHRKIVSKLEQLLTKVNRVIKA